TVTPTRNGCDGTPISFTITVNPNINPDVTMVNNALNPLCSGVPVKFTALTTAFGNYPQNYNWYLNGNLVGTNDTVYTTSTLSSNDQVWVVYTLIGAPCQSKTADTSSKFLASVYPTVTPAVTITSNGNNSICEGEMVNFYAGVTDGGSSPSFQWKVNGVNVGVDDPNYFSSQLNNGDVVTCTLVSNVVCRTTDSAFSVPITMAVHPNPTPVVTQNGSLLSRAPY